LAIAHFSTSAAVGLLLVVLGIPLARRRVKPNSAYGVRFDATMADESVWYDVNARGGRDLSVIGVVYLIVLSLAYFYAPSWSLEARIVGPLALLMIALLVEAIVLNRAANALLASRRGSQAGT
jgi:uncharacterized membrane protein